MAWLISCLHVFFTRSLYPSTRGNLFKLAKLHVVSERDKNFFKNNFVINIWNLLPDNIVAASSISSFFLIFFCSNNYVLATYGGLSVLTPVDISLPIHVVLSYE